MATTANGYIATLDDDTPWSNEEWKSYEQMVKRIMEAISCGININSSYKHNKKPETFLRLHQSKVISYFSKK